MDKRRQLECLSQKLKKSIQRNIRKGNLERAMAGISFLGLLLYQYNQYYMDDDLENYCCNISFKLNNNDKTKYQRNEIILFYDGFGTETRGIAKNYLIALGDGGYKVVYLVSQHKLNKLFALRDICKKYNFSTKRYPWRSPKTESAR